MKVANWNRIRAIGVCGLLIGCVALQGCVSKAKAKADAQAAYQAGRRDALAQLPQLLGPVVNLVGPVANAYLPWTPEMTLAKAIVDAGYKGVREPAGIVIVRRGQGIRVDPKKLLAGEDVPLEAGDIVKLEP